MLLVADITTRRWFNSRSFSGMVHWLICHGHYKPIKSLELQHTMIMFSCVGSLHYSYKLFYILTNPQGESKCKERPKMYSDTTHRTTNQICYPISRYTEQQQKKKKKLWEKLKQESLRNVGTNRFFFSEYVCAINCLIKYIFLSLKVVIYLNLSNPSMKR